MTLAWRRAFVVSLLGAVACAPILGLDDLHERAAETTDAGDAGSDTSPPVDAEATCAHNAECITAANGSPAMCVASHCVKINKELCLQQLLPDNPTLARDDVAVVAAFLPLEGVSPFLSGPGLAYTLATKEIQGAGGIQGVPHRELALLLCKSEPAFVKRALDHVIKDLRIPAILANFGSADLARLVPTDVVDAGVFTVNPSFSTDAIKFAPTKQLVWNLLGTAEDVARAYRPLLQEIRTEKLGGAELKVALVASNGSLDEPMADLLEKGQRIQLGPDAGDFDTSYALDINGNAPTSPAASAFFKRFAVDAVDSENPDPTKVTAAKNGIIAFEPDVIIALTSFELNSVLVEIDNAVVAAKNAKADGGVAKTPYWILGPSNAAVVRDDGAPTPLGAHLTQVGLGDAVLAARRARFVGIQYAGATDTTERDGWRTRMIDLHGADAAAQGLASENFYDAIYWLAYGIAAAGPDAPLEGKSFRDGVRTLVEGPKIFTGKRTTVQESYRVINLLQGAQLVGALGPPDINKAQGTWNSVGAVYCFPPPGAGALPTYDVRRYQPSDGKLSAGNPVNCTSN